MVTGSPMDHSLGSFELRFVSGKTQSDVTGDFQGITRNLLKLFDTSDVHVNRTTFCYTTKPRIEGDGTSKLGQNEASAIAL